MEPLDVAMLVLRIWAGVAILLHGVNHAKSLEGTAGWFESVGFSSAKLQALASAVVEIGVGVLLIIGLLTPVAAAGLIATMFVAFWSIHRANGFFIFRPGEGYEYVVTLAMVGLAIAIAGAGRVSIDNALGIVDNLDGWVGAAIAGAGLLSAAGQLATFWKKPAPTKEEA